MPTVRLRNVSPSPRKYGASRAIRTVSPPSGKSEDPKQKGFLNRPRRWLGGKSGWDGLQLVGVLLIPLVIFLATMGFNQQQADLAQQQREATTLQTYIDNIQDLLLNHNLLKSEPYNDVAILARARTLTALRGLDPMRKGLLVKFIYDTGLIGFMSTDNYVEPNYPGPPGLCISCLSKEREHDAIIILAEADLSEVDLSGANLYGADLHETNLTNADLRYAYLENAILSNADLSGADLSGALLGEAMLYNANLTQHQLDQVDYCSRANLPEGLTCHK